MAPGTSCLATGRLGSWEKREDSNQRSPPSGALPLPSAQWPPLPGILTTGSPAPGVPCPWHSGVPSLDPSFGATEPVLGPCPPACWEPAVLAPPTPLPARALPWAVSIHAKQRRGGDGARWGAAGVAAGPGQVASPVGWGVARPALPRAGEITLLAGEPAPGGQQHGRSGPCGSRRHSPGPRGVALGGAGSPQGGSVRRAPTASGVSPGERPLPGTAHVPQPSSGAPSSRKAHKARPARGVSATESRGERHGLVSSVG